MFVVDLQERAGHRVGERIVPLGREGEPIEQELYRMRNDAPLPLVVRQSSPATRPLWSGIQASADVYVFSQVAGIQTMRFVFQEIALDLFWVV